MGAGFGCPRESQPELAEQQFREALRIDPLHNNVRLSLTTHLWWMNRHDEAFAVLEEGLAIVPGNVMLKTWRPFNMAFAAGRTEEAFAVWRANSQDAPRRPVDAFIGGIIELKRRNFRAAADNFRTAGPQVVDTPPYPLIAAATHFQVGRMEEGATYLRRGLQAHADCPAWFDRVPAFAPFKNDPTVGAVLARVAPPKS